MESIPFSSLGSRLDGASAFSRVVRDIFGQSSKSGLCDGVCLCCRGWVVLLRGSCCARSEEKDKPALEKRTETHNE